ncbi:hypothetical protein FGW20_09900 [Methanoculleus sp. FWC-SCC3]|uniref:Restriction endonuclease type IV Mrr domain-containing protein n=1 Tax=Methanoculleus methanifontis TaxID=2584086 RepID=A0ABT8M2T4_9EURY|nr:hypothetical protein [Methanoculleus sp. FWC-SCC3]MDN7013345.1 hypothetical protein [Methanoculleus sp. FWC-SCC3]
MNRAELSDCTIGPVLKVLQIGRGFGTAKTIVLGQAKCETITSPTSGKDVARTVARLKRGWLGVYVATSYFSVAVQREIIEDEYPILLINGHKLAQIAQDIVYRKGYGSVADLLSQVNARYEQEVKKRCPEELLLE